MEITMKFHDKLYQLRTNKNLSQEKMAEQFAVSRQTVAKWETAKAYPEIDKLLPLSRFFGITVDALLDDSQCNDYSLKPKAIKTPHEQIISFLLLAKRSTYAAKEQESPPCRLASHDYYFEKAPLAYLDSFFGADQFSGEEVVYEVKVPIWSMNYIGRLVGEGFSSDFLKEALLVGNEKYPYRGPLHYTNGLFTYHNQVDGSFEWFEGYEEIFFGDNKVYECKYHGGLLL